MSLERYLAKLADTTKPIKHAGLVRLSGLVAHEMEQLKALWPTIDPARRRQIVARLVEMAEDNVDLDFTAIFKFCLKDSDEEVRRSAVEGLWECEERSLIPVLINLLRGDPSPRVQAAAAQALSKFAMLAEDGKLLPKDGERIREALLEVIHSPHQDPEVRRRAVEAIAPFNTPEVHTIIQEAYESSEPKLRQSAIFAMGRTCDPRWLPTIIKELGNPDPAMRYEAACACGEMGEEAAVPHLLPLLRDDDIQVRISAIHALGAIGGAAAKKALLSCLKSSEEAVRQAAHDALEELEGSEDPLSFKFRF